jgi:SOS-response transcriptional repressor LexA
MGRRGPPAGCARDLPPTDRQRAVLQIIADAMEAGWPAPSMREIAQMLGVNSSNTVSGFLDALIVRRLIERAPLKSRVMRVTPAGWAVLGRGRACCAECGRPFPNA